MLHVNDMLTFFVRKTIFYREKYEIIHQIDYMLFANIIIKEIFVKIAMKSSLLYESYLVLYSSYFSLMHNLILIWW